MADGGVTSWGSNAAGQLGDDTTTDRSTPTDVAGFDVGCVAVAKPKLEVTNLNDLPIHPDRAEAGHADLELGEVLRSGEAFW
ncbi:MAG TPA: RCC1 domain-containing protein [Candidatus Binatia bacterium]|nr:RCC1 domain-containing protein [Candidatus Binatia bacterium]